MKARSLALLAVAGALAIEGCASHSHGGSRGKDEDA